MEVSRLTNDLLNILHTQLLRIVVLWATPIKFKGRLFNGNYKRPVTNEISYVFREDSTVNVLPFQKCTNF